MRPPGITDATGFHQFTGNFVYDADGVLMERHDHRLDAHQQRRHQDSRCPGSFLRSPVFLADLTTSDSSVFWAQSSAADKITGSTQDDVLPGYGGNDTIDGAGGQDIIFEVLGDDELIGGAGDDIILGGDDKDISGRRRATTQSTAKPATTAFWWRWRR